MSAKDAKYEVWYLNPGRSGQGAVQDNVWWPLMVIGQIVWRLLLDKHPKN